MRGWGREPRCSGGPCQVVGGEPTCAMRLGSPPQSAGDGGGRHSRLQLDLLEPRDVGHHAVDKPNRNALFHTRTLLVGVAPFGA